MKVCSVARWTVGISRPMVGFAAIRVFKVRTYYTCHIARYNLLALNINILNIIIFIYHSADVLSRDDDMSGIVGCGHSPIAVAFTTSLVDGL